MLLPRLRLPALAVDSMMNIAAVTWIPHGGAEALRRAKCSETVQERVCMCSSQTVDRLHWLLLRLPRLSPLLRGVYKGSPHSNTSP
jgi:hypothetical protein